MKYLLCPQCGIRRFRVLNETGYAVVQVTSDKKIEPIKPEDNLSEFRCDILHCLGCSWKGSINQL